MTGLVQRFVDNQRDLAKAQGRAFKIRPPPRAVPPDDVERQYRSYVVGVVAGIRAAVEDLLVPQLDGLVRAAGERLDVQRSDVQTPKVGPSYVRRSDAVRFNLADLEATLAALGGEISARVDKQNLRGLEQTIEEYRNATSLQVQRQLRRQIARMIGLDAFAAITNAERNLLDAFVKQGRQKIVGLKVAEIERVEDIVRRGVQAGHRASAIRETVADLWPKAEARAALIARDQTNKLHGNLTRVRQTALGIERYIWRTSRDERVRESHLMKEGRIFSWSEPPPDTGHPGQDINCRCTAEPYLEGEPAPRENLDKLRERIRDKRKNLKQVIARRRAAERRQRQ